MRHSSTIAASLLALAPSVLAAGTARVVNNCGSQVYFASVGQSAHSDMAALPASGYSEAFSKDGVGISIKLSSSIDGAVTQFEYTWVSGNSVAYDISNIDGNPFSAGGMSLVPSMEGAEGFPSCVTVNCPAGQDRCDAAYNLPDDVRTKVCPENSDLTFTLCPGGAPAGGQNSGQSADPAQVSTTVSSRSQASSPVQDGVSNVVQSPSPAKGASPASYAEGRVHRQQRRAHGAQMV